MRKIEIFIDKWKPSVINANGNSEMDSEFMTELEELIHEEFEIIGLKAFTNIESSIHEIKAAIQE